MSRKQKTFASVNLKCATSDQLGRNIGVYQSTFYTIDYAIEEALAMCEMWEMSNQTPKLFTAIIENAHKDFVLKITKDYIQNTAQRGGGSAGEQPLSNSAPGEHA